MAKYRGQIDCLCINSSGVSYKGQRESAEAIACVRCNEFYKVMELAGCKKKFIAKIYGIPPMFSDINKAFMTYLEKFDFKDYDVIFVPHVKDAHREHLYVSNNLVPRLLRKSGYKKDLKIAMYEVWSTLPNLNYFEDVSDSYGVKKKLINTYQSRIAGRYSERIEGLNFYRGLVAGCEYAEALNVISVKEYLQMRDEKKYLE